MLSEIGKFSQAMNSGCSAEHEAIASSELVTSQYANLVDYRTYLTDFNTDHTNDIQNMALWIDGHMISAQDAYASWRSSVQEFYNDDEVDPESAINITLIDKETGSTFVVTAEKFTGDINAALDNAAISSAMLQQCASDIANDVVSSADTMRSSLSWALGQLPSEVSSAINSSIHEIYSGVDDPTSLYYNVKRFIGLDEALDTGVNPFDTGTSSLSNITGVSPIIGMMSGIVTTYAELYKGAAQTIAKAVVHRYYVGKFLFTTIREAYRLQWKVTKKICKKIFGKLRSTYIDPVDFECSKSKIGYFDVQLSVKVDRTNLSNYISNSDELGYFDDLCSYLNSNGPITVELFGNEYQLGIASGDVDKITIIHRQKPFDYASVAEHMGKDIGKTSWTIEDFTDYLSACTKVGKMPKGNSEQMILNNLSFARAHAGSVLMTLRLAIKKIINYNGDYAADHPFEGAFSTWTNSSIEQDYLSAVYEGFVYGKSILDGTYPMISGIHSITNGVTDQRYHDAYKEFADSVNNTDFYYALTSFTVGKRDDNYEGLYYGAQTATYTPDGYLVPQFSNASGDRYAVGRSYMDLVVLLGMVIPNNGVGRMKNLSVIKYYSGTSKFNADVTVKTDTAHIRSAFYFTGAIVAAVGITIAAVKLTPALMRFRDDRRLLADAYQTRAFNIGQKVLDGDKAGALVDLKMNRKTKRFLNLTGGSSGLISSGMSIAAIDASGVIDRLNQSITTLSSASQVNDVAEDFADGIDRAIEEINDNTNDEVTSISALIV